MSTGSLSRYIAIRRVQLSRLGVPLNDAGDSRSRIHCLCRQPAFGQRRTLLTAVTSSPTILNKYPNDTQPPPRVLPTIVDVGLAWASQAHNENDPPTHAIILISKALIPRGRDELLQALGQSTRLCGLNALVGAVDTVGEGAKGVSVLLASRSEGITIDTLKGVQNEVLRVGKWHAKDVEDGESMNFDDILASMRGEKSVSVAAAPADSSPTKDIVFVLGEMEAVQSQALAINEQYSSATIVWTY
jgi:hypothetical protein